MDTAATRKQLKIKAGSTKRLLKEHGMYREQVEDNKRKLDKLVADGAEGWDVRSATRLWEESQRMVVDTDNRLGKVVGELREVVVQAKKASALAEDEELLKAEEVLEEASL
ncbi:hypothetical protein EW146_g1534 [Bondarzewia mesenterica]|uniref:Tubulin-specific chaperone A n=1 Tax=Bondarzewia mesenterica TaxID=1095465 RepID=A0A4S4M4Z3_9AGAM|nr:hypothetical protein EW146_g1534 [Bondarzewia mesenterica]